MSERQTIKASEFKARCLRLMDDVAEGGPEIVITKRGRPVSRLVAYRESRSRCSASTEGGSGSWEMSSGRSTSSGKRKRTPRPRGPVAGDRPRHARHALAATGRRSPRTGRAPRDRPPVARRGGGRLRDLVLGGGDAQAEEAHVFPEDVAFWREQPAQGVVELAVDGEIAARVPSLGDFHGDPRGSDCRRLRPRRSLAGHGRPAPSLLAPTAEAHRRREVNSHGSPPALRYLARTGVATDATPATPASQWTSGAFPSSLKR